MTTSQRYRTVDVPVRGGDLRVGIWDPLTPDHGEDPPTVVLAHGVTASHRCWLSVANALPGIRVIAPDLRGRGRSRDLPGPYGMATHADDIAAVMELLGVSLAVVVGHSMGGFVAAALFGRHPDRVGSVVLVDGGLPLPQPEGMSLEELTTTRLGLAKQRLSMTFPDRKSYQDFFRAHPAFAGDWNEAVADYVDYDLIDEEPNLRSATPIEAMAEDSADLQVGGGWLLSALTALPDGTPFLQAERGLAGEKPGLYDTQWLASWQDRLPAVAIRKVLGVNHYTILFSPTGVAAVVAAIAEVLPAAG